MAKKSFADLLSTETNQDTIKNKLIPKLRRRAKSQAFFSFFLLCSLSGVLAWVSITHLVPSLILAGVTLGMGSIFGTVIGLTIALMLALLIVGGIVIALLSSPQKAVAARAEEAALAALAAEELAAVAEKEEARNEKIKVNTINILAGLVVLGSLTALVLIPLLGIVIAGSAVWTATILCLAAMVIVEGLSSFLNLCLNQKLNQIKSKLISVLITSAVVLPLIFVMPFSISTMILGYVAISILLVLFCLGIIFIHEGLTINAYLKNLVINGEGPLLALVIQNAATTATAVTAVAVVASVVPFLLQQGADPKVVDGEGVSKVKDGLMLSPIYSMALLPSLCSYGLDVWKEDKQKDVFMIELVKGLKNKLLSFQEEQRRIGSLLSENVNITDETDKLLLKFLKTQLEKGWMSKLTNRFRGSFNLDFVAFLKLKPFKKSQKFVLNYLLAPENSSIPDSEGDTFMDKAMWSTEISARIPTKHKNTYIARVSEQIKDHSGLAKDLADLVCQYLCKI